MLGTRGAQSLQAQPLSRRLSVHVLQPILQPWAQMWAPPSLCPLRSISLSFCLTLPPPEAHPAPGPLHQGLALYGSICLGCEVAIKEALKEIWKEDGGGVTRPGGEFRCRLGAERTKQRAGLIYRKSLSEEKEMPEAQLRPPAAPTSPLCRGDGGSRVEAVEPPSSQGGCWPCSGSAARSDSWEQSGWSDSLLSQGPGPRPGRPKASKHTGSQMHWMIGKKGHDFFFLTTNADMSYNTNSISRHIFLS